MGSLTFFKLLSVFGSTMKPDLAQLKKVGLSVVEVKYSLFFLLYEKYRERGYLI